MSLATSRQIKIFIKSLDPIDVQFLLNKKFERWMKMRRLCCKASARRKIIRTFIETREARENVRKSRVVCCGSQTKFYVTCKCARPECGRVAPSPLSVSLSLRPVASLVSFYRRSGAYETSFGVGRRLSRLGRQIFFLPRERERKEERGSPSSEILSRCRAKTALFLPQETHPRISRRALPRPSGVEMEAGLREPLYEFRHAR